MQVRGRLNGSGGIGDGGGIGGVDGGGGGGGDGDGDGDGGLAAAATAASTAVAATMVLWSARRQSGRSSSEIAVSPGWLCGRLVRRARGRASTGQGGRQRGQRNCKHVFLPFPPFSPRSASAQQRRSTSQGAEARAPEPEPEGVSGLSSLASSSRTNWLEAASTTFFPMSHAAGGTPGAKVLSSTTPPTL